MGGNPKDSKWYHTPNSRRKRKGIEVTLPDETLADLDELKERFGSRSSAVEEAIRVLKASLQK